MQRSELKDPRDRENAERTEAKRHVFGMPKAKRPVKPERPIDPFNDEHRY